ncbi:hypothetical protein E2C01_094670 [Portunus trituberculatus]|uniref:Uncharacterized protein n=1 Tax=Portunus trituberculatus TaxID=210409 RepID=A0A5B7JY97_PORTR|nr:hypothetical protein [Portunus trituberculatus]
MEGEWGDRKGEAGEEEAWGCEPKRHAVTRSPASPVGPHSIPPLKLNQCRQHHHNACNNTASTFTPASSPRQTSPGTPAAAQGATSTAGLLTQQKRQSWAPRRPPLVGGGEPKLFLGKSAVTVGLLLGVRFHWPVSQGAPPIRAPGASRIDVSGGFVSPGPGGEALVGRRPQGGHDAPLLRICFYLWIRCCGQVEGPELS